MADGSLMVFVCEADEQVVSPAFLAVSRKLPGPAFPDNLVWTVMNVLTLPEFRRKGIASELMGRLLAEGEEAGVGASGLSSSKDGEKLREKTGFRNSGLRLMFPR
jgi:GNAT superfamily N-acetyltransferase